MIAELGHANGAARRLDEGAGSLGNGREGKANFDSHAAARKRVAVLAGAAALALLWCWIESRSLASARDSHAAALRQLQQIQADVARIEALRAAPRLATEREVPNDELLAAIQKAAGAVQIPAEAWLGNDPSQPVLVPQQPYKRLEVRLSFADLTLRQIVQFACKLVEADTTLSIPRVRLTAPAKDAGDRWNAELTLSYLIFSPQQEHSGG